MLFWNFGISCKIKKKKKKKGEKKKRREKKKEGMGVGEEEPIKKKMIQSIKFWLHLLQLLKNSLAYGSLSDATSSNTNWVICIQKNLSRFGFCMSGRIRPLLILIT